jgi:hypothetical protein
LLVVLRLVQRLTIHLAVVVVRVLLAHRLQIQVLLAAPAALVYRHP